MNELRHEKFGWLGNLLRSIHCHMLFEMLQFVLVFMRVFIVIVYERDNVLNALICFVCLFCP